MCNKMMDEKTASLMKSESPRPGRAYSLRIAFCGRDAIASPQPRTGNFSQILIDTEAIRK
jgi:hypothetical protein